MSGDSRIPASICQVRNEPVRPSKHPKTQFISAPIENKELTAKAFCNPKKIGRLKTGMKSEKMCIRDSADPDLRSGK